MLKSCSLSDSASCAWGFDQHKDSSFAVVCMGCTKQAAILLRLGGLKRQFTCSSHVLKFVLGNKSCLILIVVCLHVCVYLWLLEFYIKLHQWVKG